MHLRTKRSYWVVVLLFISGWPWPQLQWFDPSSTGTSPTGRQVIFFPLSRFSFRVCTLPSPIPSRLPVYFPHKTWTELQRGLGLYLPSTRPSRLSSPWVNNVLRRTVADGWGLETQSGSQTLKITSCHTVAVKILRMQIPSRYVRPS